MKKRLFLLLMIIFFSCIVKVNANTINEIDMDIYIDNDGNAKVTETWDVDLDQGTEGYKPYYNLGNAEISNFRVSEDNEYYQEQSSWNVDDSFENKAHKSGINPINDGYELCWGITKYGHHVYKLEYNISGFVVKTTDNDMIYWTLVPSKLSSKPSTVNIKIYSDNYFSNDLPVWGYGNSGGIANVENGQIHLSSKGSLGSDEYITVLVKFNPNTFNTSNTVEENFNYYYKMAEDGAETYTGNSSIIGIIATIIVMLSIIVCVILVVFISGISNNVSGLTLKFGDAGKKLPKEVPMFRDLPCGKDIYRAYWVAFSYDLISKKTDFLGAILLKWLHEKKIAIENKEKGLIFKKEEANIVFKVKSNEIVNEYEKTLYEYMYRASKDGVLEKNEFKDWCQNNNRTILNWFDDILKNESDVLANEGKLNIETKTFLKLFAFDVYNVNLSMKEEAIRMKGLKEFFKEFENMKDKEAIEVMIWEEYLMYAQIFGVAEKVAKQFKKLYPDQITDYDYDSIVFVSAISYSGMNAAYTAGGGGYSTGGGGMGSFGGVGGGGGFR